MFRTSIESENIVAIVEAVQDERFVAEEGGFVLSFLEKLSEVERFDMAVEFLTQKERAAITAVFGMLKQDAGQAERASEVERKYLP